MDNNSIVFIVCVVSSNTWDGTNTTGLWWSRLLLW